MKRKLIAVIPILVIIAILIVILILTREKEPEGVPLFNVTEYPVSYVQNGADIEVTLDGSKTPDFAWSFVNRGEDNLEVKAKGEEKKGKITYVLSPRASGSAEVDFLRSGEVDGVACEAIRFTLPVYVSSSEEGLVVSLQTGETVSGTVVIGGATEHPIYIIRDDEGDVRLEFPKGMADWVLFDPNGEVELLSMLGDQQQTVMVPHATAAVNVDTEDTDNTESTENTEEEGDPDRIKRASELYSEYQELKRKVEAGEIELPTEEPPTEPDTDAEGNYIPSTGAQQLPNHTMPYYILL